MCSGSRSSLAIDPNSKCPPNKTLNTDILIGSINKETAGANKNQQWSQDKAFPTQGNTHRASTHLHKQYKQTAHVPMKWRFDSTDDLASQDTDTIPPLNISSTEYKTCRTERCFGEEKTLFPL